MRNSTSTNSTMMSSTMKSSTMKSSTMKSSTMRNLGVLALATLAMLQLGGCIAGAVGAIGQQIERGKKLDVPAAYDGLEKRTCAVVVNADYATLVEHPEVVGNITANVSVRIRQYVKEAAVLPPGEVLQWQYRTPQWRTMPHGEIARELGVERLVFIDLYEYRLNPLGNSYLWDGAAGANIGVIEADGLAPDEFVYTTSIVVRFPNKEGIGRESARREDIERGLLTLFVQKTSWLFYRHIEDKYPEY
ncbi:MAG: hypothetical protein ACO3IB_05585 [Phycisphaerales bacterium]